MKTIFRTAAIAALIISTSCGKDDSSTNAQLAEEQTELLEQTPLDVSVISDNVIINGGIKTEGVPPTPNGAISLDASATSKTALLNEGFDISMSSDATIVGAYLRFKSVAGDFADSYYDISIEENTSYKSSKKSVRLRRNNNAVTAKVDDFTLDVDFGEAIEPGTFCYELCVYDAEGNISLPEEACATVESWGGTPEMLGNWSLIKEETTYQGENTVSIVGEETCNINSINCNNLDEIVEFDECITIEFSNYTFNVDGSFSRELTLINKSIDYQASAEQCEAVFYENDTISVLHSGFWAFREDTSRFTLIVYELTLDIRGETTEIIFEQGRAEVLFDGDIVLNNDAFIITDNSELDNSYIYNGYFSKN